MTTDPQPGEDPAFRMLGEGRERRVGPSAERLVEVPAVEAVDVTDLRARVAAELPLDTDTYRRVVGRFATGVTVVTAVVDGLDHAMTASAFTSVSLDPILALVCVEKEARFHDAVLEAGCWAVSVLSESGRHASQWFASRGRPLHGQLDRFAHHRGRLTGAALLDDSIATLECRTRSAHDGGDHTIVLGEVMSLGMPRHEAPALVYYRGRYHSLG